ncbi:hypothetical protein PQJ75_10135 [Rhodoplanes sp. TEM]|uniref:Uncharacterized protein n=1 Tax=Rhodoplanes tepidamans TaxID=200616 RepID=A0ABT5J835_RHOTP|nr:MULTISPECIES: hypothetical protein [Rhodoplanes]MDC7785821.1 hypothetical protein [Rhodoplanes tepidamans]MDC7984088.1 hypothetical protein [Rhodoplanes sp. TEM]MDQ0354616.1 hypothetical protein [Rhodoplanes tepidamans]
MSITTPGLWTSSRFDRATIAAMEEAFERVCGTLHCGQALTLVKAAAAMHIMTRATEGERDPARLCAQALEAIGFRQPTGRAEKPPAVPAEHGAAAVAPLAPSGEPVA